MKKLVLLTAVLTVLCLCSCGKIAENHEDKLTEANADVPSVTEETKEEESKVTENDENNPDTNTKEPESPDEKIPSDESSKAEKDTEEAKKEEKKQSEETKNEEEPSLPIVHVIKTENGITYADGILIVNKTYSIPESYGNGITSEVKTAFNNMAAAAKKQNIKLSIISGYRSYSRQKTIYENYVARDGIELADTYSARPGYSEHQTGLALDINSCKDSFANTDAGKWLAEHCAEYGFIIRYPKGKEGITGYKYEPWHIRYVGVTLAKELTKKGLCLEEYFGITSEYAEEYIIENAEEPEEEPAEEPKEEITESAEE